MSDGPSPSPLAAAVDRARHQAAFLDRIRAVYGLADDRLSARREPCRRCGECCRFDRSGHRLFVSTGELAVLLGGAAAPAPPAPLRCPYQAGSLCLARERRALGCRCYGCADEAEWSAGVYEECHAAIRAAHDAHAVPYLYVELMGALASLAAENAFAIDLPPADR